MEVATQNSQQLPSLTHIMRVMGMPTMAVHIFGSKTRSKYVTLRIISLKVCSENNTEQFDVNLTRAGHERSWSAASCFTSTMVLAPLVPISFIASWKKIKSLISNHHLLAQALRSSSVLVVTNDGKKVKRKNLFTDKDREELLSCTVVADNLPDDHSHHNLEKIFSVVGRVKTVQICRPQESNSSRPKGDLFISNKLHALVEYETPEIAEIAVEKLNDERNWRQGLRVRLLLRCSPKSVLKSRKLEFNEMFGDDEATPESAEDSYQPHNPDLVTESISHNGCGLLPPSPQSSISIQCEVSAKRTTKGPRMPDGTRGFTMGRGKPLPAPALGSSNLE
ncbi:RNA-binding protein [Actinidia rufa]|uniref:RNA-binding protein n=1 Tax=Actinidia rufa TaxID=165716 RepID=A0A7J0DU18_9ERIC|nr:RNA-binding protein [Actinidia rufa]